MTDLDLNKLRKVLDYLWSINGQLDEREKMMAAQVGVDIDKDLLMVPEKMIKGIRWLPAWIKGPRFVKEPYVMKDVRDGGYFLRNMRGERG